MDKQGDQVMDRVKEDSRMETEDVSAAGGVVQVLSGA